MFTIIANIYSKKTKGPTLMELLTATGEMEKFFWQLEAFDVCTTGDTAHINTIFKLLPHARHHSDNLNIVSMCAVSPVVHTSNISSYQKKKKNFFNFPVAVNSSIKIGPSVFLL